MRLVTVCLKSRLTVEQVEFCDLEDIDSVTSDREKFSSANSTACRRG